MPTLDFIGRSFIYTHHLGVPEGQQANLDDNLIIHGDNLEALKALLPCCAAN